MNLTPNFTLEEFTRSAEAEKHLIKNDPILERDRFNLNVTAYGMETVRRLLRQGFGNHIVIRVTSGYRCPALNAIVGGTPGSAHALGLACDFIAKLPKANNTLGYSDAKRIARYLAQRLPYDQLILESARGIVHISFDPRLRMQDLTQEGGPGTPIKQGHV